MIRIYKNLGNDIEYLYGNIHMSFMDDKKKMFVFDTKKITYFSTTDVEKMVNHFYNYIDIIKCLSLRKKNLIIHYFPHEKEFIDFFNNEENVKNIIRNGLKKFSNGFTKDDNIKYVVGKKTNPKFHTIEII